jgi:hypothetical protein
MSEPYGKMINGVWWTQIMLDNPAALQTFDCDQGSEDWFRARMGIPTASEFATVMAKGAGKTRLTYMRKLAGEILTGDPMENYSNAHMERGKLMEDEARELYAFAHDAECTRVGFIKCPKRNAGVSPDSLIGEAGGLEIKTKLPHLLIECWENGNFPPEHKAQCQGFLWLTGREWIDIAVYWPKLQLFVKRAHRDEQYIAELATAVSTFNDELAEMVERQRRRGTPITHTLKAALEMEHGISQ